MERQQDYTLMEGYTLPSKGQIYQEFVNPNVELRAMTGRDEMKRLAPSTMPLKVLADIIEDCLIEKPAVHVYDMAIGDYEYLLHKLRVVTYGSDYKVELRCPECGKFLETTVDLDSLKVNEFDLQDFNAKKTITLPVSKKVIQFRILSPRLMDKISQKQQTLSKRFKDTQINWESYATMTTCIESIDGQIIDEVQAEKFIDNIHAKDLLALDLAWNKFISCVGIDPVIYVKCPYCGEDVKTFFRFGPEFFRPTTI